MLASSSTQRPDGIDDPDELRRRPRFAGGFRLLVIGIVPLLALTGVLGGGPSPVVSAETPRAELTLKTPATVRSGILFETDIDVRARTPIRDAVIAVPVQRWRDLTINTTLPDPQQVEATGGEFRFHFGPLRTGQRLSVKVDGQVNPPLVGRTEGHVRLLDGEVEIARVPDNLLVLP